MYVSIHIKTIINSCFACLTPVTVWRFALVIPFSKKNATAFDTDSVLSVEHRSASSTMLRRRTALAEMCVDSVPTFINKKKTESVSCRVPERNHTGNAFVTLPAETADVPFNDAGFRAAGAGGVPKFDDPRER